MKNPPQCERATCGLRRHLDYRIARLTTQAHDLGQRLDAVTRQRDALQAEVDRLRVTVKELQAEVYGPQSERSRPPAELPPSAESLASTEPATPSSDGPAARRSRGHQPGAPGHGRHRHPNLPEVVVDHEVPTAERRCPRCRLPYRDLGDAQPTEELDWEVRVIRRVHRRHRYLRTCTCPDTPAVVTASGPDRPIRKGLFSSTFLAQLVIEKFLLGLPLHRIRQRLAMAGLTVSAGTLTGVLHRVQEFLEPWYRDCEAANQTERQIQADETGWPLYDETGRHRGWLWVFIGLHTTVFQVAMTRGGRIVRQHFGLGTNPDASAPAPGESEPRYLVSDFYGAYQQLERHGWTLVGCWAHARRPILRVGRTHPDLEPWAAAWRTRVAHLYQQYRAWRASPADSAARRQAQAGLEAHLAAMRQGWTEELVDPALPEVAREALRLMARHWDRLTQFLQNPELPLDNNAAERCLRTPVIGRKNFLGSRARWAGDLAAHVWTFAETARQHGLDPLAEVTRYFEACAAAGGQPPPRDARTAFHFWGPTAPTQEDTS